MSELFKKIGDIYMRCLLASLYILVCAIPLVIGILLSVLTGSWLYMWLCALYVVYLPALVYMTPEIWEIVRYGY